MSETRKKQAKRFVPNPLRSIAPLALVLTLGSASAVGESLDAYGARMCADAGIPLEECSLVNDPAAAGAADEESVGGKAATLIDHGRRVCEQENVPYEDCMALPSAYRADQASAPPPPPPPVFPILPAMLPPVDPALLAAAPPPQPGGRFVRTSRPSAPLPVGTTASAPASARAGDPGIRYLRPPPPPAPALPVEPDTRFFQPPPPPPVEPDFRFTGEPRPFAPRGDALAFERERPERFLREDRLLRDDDFRRDRGFRGEERSGRCRRAVRFPGPASNRFITC